MVDPYAASSVPSSVDKGLCMGSAPSNLVLESGFHASGVVVVVVEESGPNHSDRCGVRRNSYPADRLKSTGGV